MSGVARSEVARDLAQEFFDHTVMTTACIEGVCEPERRVRTRAHEPEPRDVW